MQFDWDSAKAKSNLAKHSVPFEAAIGVFDDPFGYETRDDREAYGEERFVAVGMVVGVLLWVVYTERDGRIRLISARRATRKEQDDYFGQIA